MVWLIDEDDTHFIDWKQSNIKYGVSSALTLSHYFYPVEPLYKDVLFDDTVLLNKAI